MSIDRHVETDSWISVQYKKWKKMKKLIVAVLVSFVFTTSYSQEKSEFKTTFSGYIETYYSYDFGNPDNHVRPGFMYSHNKHNELNLNLGMAKVAITKDIFRGNLALMAGTYAQYNLAAEQDLMKNIYEANVGVKISSKHNLWVDAGILPSHIGAESAIGKDCINLTRSLSAENSPYYEAGVKIGYTSQSEKWYWAVLYLNGWQRIQKVDGNQTPAFGTQVTYKPSGKTTLNWSTYVGNEQPDEERKWRYFNNFYGQFTISEKTTLLTGFDIGVQQKLRGSSQYDTWYTPVIIAQYKPNSKIQLGARGEYYQDKNGVMIMTDTPNGFKTLGYSANFDYKIADNVLFRIEARSLTSKDAVFMKNGDSTNSNTFLTTSLAIAF